MVNMKHMFYDKTGMNIQNTKLLQMAYVFPIFRHSNVRKKQIHKSL